MSQGSQKLAVLLCKYGDHADTEPENVQYFTDLFVNRGTGGLNDYWRDASLGAINLDTTEVFEWRTLEQNRADYLNTHPSRADKIQGAVDAFSIDRTQFAGIVALFNADPGDSGAAGAGVLGGPAISTSRSSPTRRATSSASVTPSISPSARTRRGQRRVSTTTCTTS
jgi:hypothetical protein